ncbi:MAG: hypothetical protein ABSF23_08815 [Terracidiphilus sp.]
MNIFRISDVRREARARSRREAREEEANSTVFVDSPSRKDFDQA